MNELDNAIVMYDCSLKVDKNLTDAYVNKGDKINLVIRSCIVEIR